VTLCIGGQRMQFDCASIGQTCAGGGCAPR
jgi:hypothetical protein